MRKKLILLGSALLVLLMAAPTLWADVPSALLHEGDILAGDTVTSLGNPSANHAGGYGLGINTSDGTNTFSRFWGNPAGGAGSILRTEGTIGDYQQLSFESFWGMSNAGAIAYSPSCTHVPSGTTGLDSVWLDDTIVAIEEQPYPHMANYWWSFGSRPGITADGKPYFVGGIATTQGGTTANRGLFYGSTTTPLLLGGDAVPNLPAVLDTASTVSFDYRFSSLGTNYLAEVQFVGPSTANAAMVMNGAGLMLGGGLVAEGSPIPTTIGGLPGELWANFDFLSITESGSWIMTGDSNADVAVDEFVALNGNVALREGDMLTTGEIVSGAIEGGYMNEAGDWGVIWDIDGGVLEALIVNGSLLLKEGDAVDWDGDGFVDPDAILTDFTGTSTLAIGDPGIDSFFDVYFTADINVGGTVLEGFFQMTVPEPSAALLLGVGLMLLRRRR
ncbi:MAG: PEP-CTERM sorting domain-containing protein [Planctomycetota bacterium]